MPSSTGRAADRSVAREWHSAGRVVVVTGVAERPRRRRLGRDAAPGSR